MSCDIHILFPPSGISFILLGRKQQDMYVARHCSGTVVSPMQFQPLQWGLFFFFFASFFLFKSCSRFFYHNPVTTSPQFRNEESTLCRTSKPRMKKKKYNRGVNPYFSCVFFFFSCRSVFKRLLPPPVFVA